MEKKAFVTFRYLIIFTLDDTIFNFSYIFTARPEWRGNRQQGAGDEWQPGAAHPRPDAGELRDAHGKQ